MKHRLKIVCCFTNASWLVFESSLHRMSCIEQHRNARGAPNGRIRMFRVGR